MAITYVADESDAAILNEVQNRFEVQITEMPDEIDVATYSKYCLFFIRFFHRIFLMLYLNLVENR